MLDQAREQENRADHRAGVIASVMANCWRDAKSQPFTPRDWFPGLPESEPYVMDDDAICAAFAEIEAQSKALTKKG